MSLNELEIAKISALLSIASDKTRLKIMFSILNKEKNVGEIVREVGESQSLVSHQLRVLKDAKLVSYRREGNFIYYSLDDEHIFKLLNVAKEHAAEEKK